MRSVRRPLLSVLCLASALLLQSGCINRGQLDPAGPYQGDTLLVQVDEVIVQTTAVFDDIIALADRNALAVAANPRLAEAVAKIRAELDGDPQPQETLTRLFLARDAYEAAKSLSSGESLRGEIAVARTALETARALLPLFVPASP